MSDDPAGAPEFDSAAFEEWVERTAQSKDISRGEVLDQMLSSYWILEELTGMMDEAKQGNPRSRLGRSTAENDPERQSEEAGAGDDGGSPNASEDDGGSRAKDRDPHGGDASELIREFQELRSAILETPKRDENRRGRDWADRRWGEPEHPPARSRQRQPDGRLRTTLSDLQDRVEDLSDRLEDVQDTHEEDVAALEADVEETLDTLANLESSVEDLVGHSELESLAVSLEQELSRIKETTNELEGRLTQVEEAHAETAEELAGVTDAQADIETRLEREFDSIENVFQHLLDKTDDLEYRIGAASDSHSEDMDSVENHLEERRQLVSLMREAQQKDISRAVCDNCETSVDLGLLEEPRCPDCDRRYTGLVEGGWLPFDKPKLETEPIQTASEDLKNGSPEPSELLENSPSDGPRT